MTEERLARIEASARVKGYRDDDTFALCAALRDAWAVIDAARAYIEKYDEKYDGIKEGWPKVQRDILRSTLTKFDEKV